MIQMKTDSLVAESTFRTAGEICFNQSETLPTWLCKVYPKTDPSVCISRTTLLTRKLTRSRPSRQYNITLLILVPMAATLLSTQ